MFNYQFKKEKVFCIGLNKTGTTSIGDALEHLGYRRSGWDPIKSSALILRWYEERLEPIHSHVHQYDVFEDLPWPLLYKEMDIHYENARFILTVRKTPEIWLDSQIRHLNRIENYFGTKLVYGSFSAERDPEMFLNRYIKHIEDVNSYFSGRPHKLLQLTIQESLGWNELCNFLEIGNVPNIPFPHSNQYKRKSVSPVAQDEKEGTLIEQELNGNK